MKATLFKEVSYSLSKLIEDIDMGEIGLPEIQRPFVWTPAKVRDLFDSMYRGFPVGYLLFWANGTGNGNRQIGTDAKQKVPRLLIVDGQQRLTSLYAVLKGQPVMTDSYEAQPIQIAFRPRDQRFEVTDAAVRKDPEFIANISELWSLHTSSYGFIKDFVAKLKAYHELNPEEESAIASAIDGVYDLRNYPFTALELSQNVDEESVAEVFVRINSKGVVLRQADFILTLMSVFWDEGRAKLEKFCREARTPAAAGASPFNHFLQPEPDDLLRVSVALGFRRARLKHVYSILRGKDLETEVFSDELRVKNFEVLQAAQAGVLDLTNWHEFLKTLVSAGYRSASMITSTTALVYAYAMYLIGKRDYGVGGWELRKVIARWYFMTALTGRYSSSPETQMDSDLQRLRRVNDAAGFTAALDEMVGATLTEDFWNINLPNALATAASRSPSLYGYYAALSLLGARALFSNLTISELLDPYLKAHKSPVETHHLFPKNYLKKLGIEDRVMVNQLANFAWVEWDDNIEISDVAPADYWPEYSRRYKSEDELRMAMEWHALPENWTALPYETFLETRRKLLAGVVRKGFEVLRGDMPTSEEDEKALDAIVSPPMELAAPGVALNPFPPQRTAAKVFNILADGEWHSIPLMETRFKKTLEKRLKLIGNKGKRSRRWTLEQEGDRVRLSFDSSLPSAEESEKEGAEGLSKVREAQLRFWTVYRAYMQQNSTVRCGKAKPGTYLVHRLGRSNAAISSEVATFSPGVGFSGPLICVELELWGEAAKENFASLYEKREEIERSLGASLTWHNLESNKTCSVYLAQPADYFNEKLWPEQHQWLKTHVELFHRVFLPYIEKFREPKGADQGIS